MLKLATPPEAQAVLLYDAIQRDLPTARRAALLAILWHERYLTREQMIARVECRLGSGCFGRSAREDNFYRDMRIVKRAMKAAGQQVRYSRSPQSPGYYLKGQPMLSQEYAHMLAGSAGEVDPHQIEIFRRMPLPARIRQGFSVSQAALRAVSHRLRQEDPELGPAEANRLALQRAYAA